jgi:hypothetical protein
MDILYYGGSRMKIIIPSERERPARGMTAPAPRRGQACSTRASRATTRRPSPGTAAGAAAPSSRPPSYACFYISFAAPVQERAKQSRGREELKADLAARGALYCRRCLAHPSLWLRASGSPIARRAVRRAARETEVLALPCRDCGRQALVRLGERALRGAHPRACGHPARPDFLKKRLRVHQIFG